MTEPTVRETTRTLRLVVLALVVLVLGTAVVCSLQPRTVTRIRTTGKPDPLAWADFRKSLPTPLEVWNCLPGPLELGGAGLQLELPQLHERPPRIADSGPSGALLNLEPGESRFLRLRAVPRYRSVGLSG